jgi:hypothetical protein
MLSSGFPRLLLVREFTPETRIVNHQQETASSSLECSAVVAGNVCLAEYRLRPRPESASMSVICLIWTRGIRQSIRHPRPRTSGDIAMNKIRRDLIEKLWRGHDPFLGFPENVHPIDMQGWNSGHEYLADCIRSLRPEVTVEVGVWKGGSAITLAKALRDSGVEGAVVAVDTWLGSWEHWLRDERFPDMRFEFGYPKLYHTFVANVINAGVQDYIVPLPLDSTNAYNLLSQKKIVPTVVHIDGGHDFDAVTIDLDHWWNMLPSGGVIIGDDYDPKGVVWPSVRDAIDAFIARQTGARLESTPYKCRIWKP